MTWAEGTLTCDACRCPWILESRSSLAGLSISLFRGYHRLKRPELLQSTPLGGFTVF